MAKTKETKDPWVRFSIRIKQSLRDRIDELSEKEGLASTAWVRWKLTQLVKGEEE